MTPSAPIDKTRCRKTPLSAHFLLANRRAARIEEIEAHGRPVSFRGAIHQSKKVYNRKALKRQASDDDLPLSLPSITPPAWISNDIVLIQECIKVSPER